MKIVLIVKHTLIFPKFCIIDRRGDFLGEHRDIVFHTRQGLSSYIEIITLLSNLGSLFLKGGLFIRTKK